MLLLKNWILTLLPQQTTHLEPSQIIIFNIALAFFDDLLFAEASGNYTRIITTGLTLVPMMTLTALEAQLPSLFFIRVHRSYIINKSKISHVEGNRVSIGGLEIAIGENFKERFFKELGFNL